MGIKRETVKTTVEIDADIFYLAKLRSLKEKRPLKEVINDSLSRHLGVKTLPRRKINIKIGGHKLGGVKGNLRRTEIYEDF